VGELVQRSGVTGDDQAAVAQVDVVEEQLADGLGACGVDGGQGQSEAGRWCDRGGESGADLGGLQRLHDGVVVVADADSGGGVTEDGGGLFTVSKQRPQDAEGVVSLAAVQRVCAGQDVFAGDLA
jgi:hypothetical protein